MNASKRHPFARFDARLILGNRIIDPRFCRHISRPSFSNELKSVSELPLIAKLTENAESVPLGVLAFIPSVLRGLRHSAFGAGSLCSARVRFRIRTVPLQFPRFGSKLSDSLVAAGSRVNTRVPLGVSKGTLFRHWWRP